MNDIKDDKKPNEPRMDDHLKKMGGILFQYGTLYDRWSEDRKSFSELGFKISQTLDSVKEEMLELKKVEESIQETIVDRVNKTMEPLTHKIANHMLETLYKEIEIVRQEIYGVTKGLKEKANSASNGLEGIVSKINRYYEGLDRRERKYNDDSVKVFTTCLFACVASGVLGSLVTTGLMKLF